jgi:hypothetical protein
MPELASWRIRREEFEIKTVSMKGGAINDKMTGMDQTTNL